jgi:hypothetical protein
MHWVLFVMLLALVIVTGRILHYLQILTEKINAIDKDLRG